MVQTKSKAGGGRSQISYGEFMARHESELSELDFLLRRPPVGSGMLSDAMRPNRWPLPPLMQELKSHPLFRLLRAAARENCADAYNELLYLWLCKMRVTPPEGVFLEPRKQPGRPRDERTSIIYEKWIEIGKPPIGRQKLAIYGAEFTKASGSERKKMVDRCGRAVKRHEAQLLLKPA